MKKTNKTRKIAVLLMATTTLGMTSLCSCHEGNDDSDSGDIVTKYGAPNSSYSHSFDDEPISTEATEKTTETLEEITTYPDIEETPPMTESTPEENRLADIPLVYGPPVAYD